MLCREGVHLSRSMTATCVIRDTLTTLILVSVVFFLVCGAEQKETKVEDTINAGRVRRGRNVGAFPLDNALFEALGDASFEVFVQKHFERHPRIVSLIPYLNTSGGEAATCESWIALLGINDETDLRNIIMKDLSVRPHAISHLLRDDDDSSGRGRPKSLSYGFGEDLTMVKSANGKDGELWTSILPFSSHNSNTSGRGGGRKMWHHVSGAFSDGFSLVMNMMESRTEPLHKLCMSIASLFGFVSNANVYFTPSPVVGEESNQGFEIHWDPMDSVIVQLAGTKEWEVWFPMIDLPLEHQRIKPKQAQVNRHAMHRAHQCEMLDRQGKINEQSLENYNGEDDDTCNNYDQLAELGFLAGQGKIDIVMQPCDVLYLPRGWIHAARTTTESSLHVTLGISTQAITFVDAVRDIISEFNRAARDMALRNPNPEDESAFALVGTVAPIDSIIGVEGPLLSCGDFLQGMLSAFTNTTEAVPTRRAFLISENVMEATNKTSKDRIDASRFEAERFIRWALEPEPTRLEKSLRLSMKYIVKAQSQHRDRNNQRHIGPVDPIIGSPSPGDQLLIWSRKLLRDKNMLNSLMGPMTYSLRALRQFITIGFNTDGTTNVEKAISNTLHRADIGRHSQQRTSRVALNLHSEIGNDEL